MGSIDSNNYAVVSELRSVVVEKKNSLTEKMQKEKGRFKRFLHVIGVSSEQKNIRQLEKMKTNLDAISEKGGYSYVNYNTNVNGIKNKSTQELGKMMKEVRERQTKNSMEKAVKREEQSFLRTFIQNKIMDCKSTMEKNKEVKIKLDSIAKDNMEKIDGEGYKKLEENETENTKKYNEAKKELKELQAILHPPSALFQKLFGKK